MLATRAGTMKRKTAVHRAGYQCKVEVTAGDTQVGSRAPPSRGMRQGLARRGLGSSRVPLRWVQGRSGGRESLGRVLWEGRIDDQGRCTWLRRAQIGVKQGRARLWERVKRA